MKRLLYLLIAVHSLAFAQPSKNYLQGVSLQNDTLKQLMNGMWTVQGTVLPSIKLDSRGNFLLPRNNVSTGHRNNLLGMNITAGGTANDIRGNNHIVGNVIGVDVSGADHTIYNGADYSNTRGDAHNTLCIGCETGGFGNYALTRYGTTLGMNNSNGSLTRSIDLAMANRYQASFLHGAGMRLEGNYSFGHGRLLYLQGDNITAFGYANGNTPFRINTPNSFNVVHNGKLVFQITETGQVMFNGALYTWPTEPGPSGSVLTNDGNGNLYWSTASHTVTAKQTGLKEGPLSFKVYNASGQLLFYQQATIQR